MLFHSAYTSSTMRNLLCLFILFYIKNLQYVNSNRTTANVTTTPLNVTNTPLNVTTTPLNVTTTPLNVTTAPLNVTTTPLNTTRRQDVSAQPDVPKTTTYEESDTDFNPTDDAIKLSKAMVGFGTDEDALIAVIGNRTNSQRQEIAKMYEKNYGKDLIHDLRGETSGNFRVTLTALMTKPADYLAKELNQALTSIFFSNDDTIYEILSTRNKYELKPILAAYKKLYNKTLTSEIEGHKPYDYGALLFKLVTGKLRDVSNSTDSVKAKDQVNLIPKSRGRCLFIENQPLYEFMAKESFAQIKLVSETFMKINNKSLLKQLEESCHNDKKLLKAFSTIVRYADDSIRYYAEELYKAMVGFGTDDRKLIRILVSRSEIDLDKIKNKYNELYGKTLELVVDAETSGYYEKLLLAVLRHAN